MLDMEMGCCLGSEGNGVSMGGGDEGRPKPPDAVNAQQRQGQHGEG